MSGRRARQYREARARLDSIPSCECGAGIVEEGDAVVLTAHEPECAQLVAMAELGRRGFCSECGYRHRRVTSGPWSRWWCPNGHSHGMSMAWPL